MCFKTGLKKIELQEGIPVLIKEKIYSEKKTYFANEGFRVSYKEEKIVLKETDFRKTKGNNENGKKKGGNFGLPKKNVLDFKFMVWNFALLYIVWLKKRVSFSAFFSGSSELEIPASFFSFSSIFASFLYSTLIHVYSV